MSKRERSIIIGTILGDAFLQKTGKRNARLRFEHSAKQREYIFWKWRELKRYMQDRPKRIERFNPIWKKRYVYYRCQSHASPEFGKLRAMFYHDHQKQIPNNIKKFLTSLALAVWFMDDGYYYQRNQTAYLYLSRLRDKDINQLKIVLTDKFDLHPCIEKKKHGLNFKFSVTDTRKLISIITPHVIPSMRYKIGEKPRID